MGGNPLEPRPTFLEKYMAEEEKSEETFKVNTGDDDKTIDVEEEDDDIVLDTSTGKGLENVEIHTFHS